jgi:hypothetical protein
MRRRWLAQLLLVLYVAFVHGLPALHLGWHKNDHVHELGGLRWLQPRLHAHALSTAHPGPVHEVHADERECQARLRPVKGSPALGFALHLALGPSHGQQSMLAPSVLVSLALVQPTRPLVVTQLFPSLREVLAKPRARAPPTAV